MEVLLLPVDGELYTVPIQVFREVVAAPRLTRLPSSPEPVLGLINVRGEIIPLFDIGAMIGAPSTRTAPYAAVLDTPSGPAAVAVTSPPSTESLGARAGGSVVAGSRGVYMQGERLAVLLDFDSLLSRIHR